MKKIVINHCFGGFELSQQMVLELWRRGRTDLLHIKDIDHLPGWTPHNRAFTETDGQLKELAVYSWEVSRDDPDLIDMVEKGFENTEVSNLVIEEYDETKYSVSIDEYDGSEDLVLTPRVSLAKLKELGASEELIKYLDHVINED